MNLHDTAATLCSLLVSAWYRMFSNLKCRSWLFIDKGTPEMFGSKCRGVLLVSFGGGVLARSRPRPWKETRELHLSQGIQWRHPRVDNNGMGKTSGSDYAAGIGVKPGPPLHIVCVYVCVCGGTSANRTRLVSFFPKKPRKESTNQYKGCAPFPPQRTRSIVHALKPLKPSKAKTMKEQKDGKSQISYPTQRPPRRRNGP